MKFTDGFWLVKKGLKARRTAKGRSSSTRRSRKS